MEEKLQKTVEAYLEYRLWEELDEDDIFAVKLSSGETGFVSITTPEKNGGPGLPESGCSTLELYCGDYGIESMLDAHVYSDVFDKSEFAGFEKFFARTCLIVAADGDGAVSFKKAAAYRGRQEIIDDKEKELLREAILAAVSIGENGWKEPDEQGEESPAGKGESPEGEEDGAESEEDRDLVPLYVKDGENFAFKKFIVLPEPCTELDPKIKLKEAELEELLSLPKEGNWECEIIFVPEAKDGAEGEPPYYDHMLMMVNNSTGASLVSEPFREYRLEPERAGQAFIKLLQLRKIRPEGLIARDDRTYELLAGVCEMLETDISQTEELPILDAVQTAILHRDKEAQKKAEEEFEKFIDSLCEIPDEAFEQVPQQVLDEVKALIEMGVITGEKAEKIKKRIGEN